MKSLALVALAAGGALCIALIAGASHAGWPPTETAVIAYSAGFVGLTIGIVVWLLRPDSRTGPLLAAFVLSGLLSDLQMVFKGDRFAVTIGIACAYVAIPVFGQLVLGYPSGRVRPRLDRALVAAGWTYAVFFGLADLLFYDPRPVWQDSIFWYQHYVAPFTHVAGYDATRLQGVRGAIELALVVVFLALLTRKLVRATPGGRSVVLPLTAAAAFAAVQAAVQLIVFGAPVNSWLHHGWFWVVTIASLGIPVSLAVGMLWGRRARLVVADLVVELQNAPPGSVRDALARALGDPTLELALWLPERGAYVDGHGLPFALPAAGEERAVTVLGPANAPVAALVHDPALLDRPSLLASAGAAARLALENERLQAELRAQLVELRASRARIVTAGDEERRRLERNLHDGAQQRLLSVGLALQLLRAKAGPEANGAGELLDEADQELRAALDELRELARGIHPAILAEQGLGPALQTLAERSPVPVTVAAPRQRVSPVAEAAVYFLVSEALANVAKYARASSVHVGVTNVDGHVIVDVDDDGVGGADPERGSGLRGLADRVHALGGEIALDSPRGHGTRLHADIPCA